MTADAMAPPTSMRAAVAERYGTDALELKEIETPALPDDRILVRVRAASLNKLDWYVVTGTPLAARVMTGLRRPKSRLIGNDFAGVVEAVGKDIQDFRPGDEVFGANTGALAEIVRTMDGWVAPKPANLSFEEAAAVPIAALTALQGLRDRGQVQPGQHVLVHGASGGVGTFAVQIAKVLGAEVTAVCSTRNVEQARALGADDVVDYTKEDVTSKRPALRRDHARRRAAFVAAVQAPLDAGGKAHPRRRDRQQLPRATRLLRTDVARVTAVAPDGRLLHREVQPARSGRHPGAPGIGPDQAGRREALRAEPRSPTLCATSARGTRAARS